MKSIFTVVALVMSIMASIAHANYNAQQCVNGQCSAPSNNVYSVYSTPQPVSQTVYGQSLIHPAIHKRVSLFILSRLNRSTHRLFIRNPRTLRHRIPNRLTTVNLFRTDNRLLTTSLFRTAIRFPITNLFIRRAMLNRIIHSRFITSQPTRPAMLSPFTRAVHMEPQLRSTNQ